MTSNNRYCPQHLYKYMSPDRTDVLTFAHIRYTQLSAFNDPFEGRPEITNLGTEEDARSALKEALPAETKRAYEMLDPRAREMIPYEAWEQLIGDLAKEKEPQLIKQFEKMTPLAAGWIHSKFDRLLGALCLSEVPDSLLMWSHYGQSHTGFVIEFNAHHSHFNTPLSIEDEFRHLRRVLYREARPSAPLSQMGGTDLFLVKSGHWAYEREWRILRALEEAESVINDNEHSIHLFSFPRETVTAIILGARCSLETEVEIRNALQNNPDFSTTKIKRANPDPTHFLLRLNDA